MTAPHESALAKIREDVLDLLTASGPAAGGDAQDRERHATSIDWALRNGRWACVMGQDARLLGWIGWLRTNGRGARLLRRFGSADALARHQRFPPADRGSYLYITDATVAQDAPPGTLLRLVREALRRNPQARKLCARIAKRPAGRRWREGRVLRKPA